MRPTILAALCATLLSSGAHAATFTPTRLDDPTPNGCAPADCSLREAVIDANANPGADTIVLSSGTYVLTRSSASADTPLVADLDVTESLSIMGPGSGATRIRNMLAEAPSREARIIEVKLATSFELRGVVLERGRMHSSNTYPWGGCLFTLMSGPKPAVLTDVDIGDCKAQQGGGLALANNAQLRHMRVLNNRAVNGAGYWQAGGTATWESVWLDHNVATGVGGGLLIDGAGPNVTTIQADLNSAIAQNSAARGGGIAVRNPNRLKLTGPLATPAAPGALFRILLNVATDQGGGVYADQGWLELNGVLLQDNEADSGGGIAARAQLLLNDAELRDNLASRGGGIWSQAPKLELRRVALTGNSANYGGGIHAEFGQSAVLGNVSAFDNSALEGGALWFNNMSGTVLINTSMHQNTGYDGSEGLLQFGGSTYLSASWMGDGCYIATGTVNTLGGNAQRSGTLSCALGTADVGSVSALDAGVSQGNYGGRFDVIGFTAGASKLQDGADGALCMATDIRGHSRVDGQCDVGAFEVGAPAP